MNRADKMLAALEDGQPHTRHEIFNAAGCFFLTNNAASELRDRGLTIEQWREGEQFLYRLAETSPSKKGESAAALPTRADPSERDRAKASAGASEPDGDCARSHSEQLDLFKHQPVAA